MNRSKKSMHQELVEIRRARVLEYISTGYTTSRAMAEKLHVDHTTILRDISYLRGNCDRELRNHFKSLPLEVKKCMTGLELTIREYTDMIQAETASEHPDKE